MKRVPRSQDKKTAAIELDIERLRYAKEWTELSSVLQKYAKIAGKDPVLEAIVRAELALEAKDFAQTRQLLDSALGQDPNDEEALCLIGLLAHLEARQEEAVKYWSRLTKPSSLNVNEHDFTARHIGLYVQSYTLCARILRTLDESSPVRATPKDYYYYAWTVVRDYFSRAPQGIAPSTREYTEEAMLALAELTATSATADSVVLLRSFLTQSPFDLSPVVRRRLLSQLAHLLLHCTSTANYPPLVSERPALAAAADEDDSDSGPREYIPHDAIEEGLLALQLQEHLQGRAASDKDGLLYSDALFAYCRRFQYRQAVEVAERAVIDRFDDAHQWQQLGMALAAAGRPQHALFILHERLQLDSHNPLLLAVCAKLCINHFAGTRLADALGYAEKLIKGGAGPHAAQHAAARQRLLPRAHHALGVAHSRRAMILPSFHERRNDHRAAVAALRTAVDLDPGDPLVRLHLAMALADVRAIREALEQVRNVLAADPGMAPAWQLLALLLSACKDYHAALDAADAGLAHVGEDDIGLLLIKAKLWKAVGEQKGLRAALGALKAAFAEWRRRRQALQAAARLMDADDRSDDAFTENLERSHALSVVADGLGGDTAGAAASGTLTEPIAASRSQAGDGSVVSSESGISPAAATAPQLYPVRFPHAYTARSEYDGIEVDTAWSEAELWLLAVEVFGELRQFDDATACLLEAKAIALFSPEVHYRDGLLEELQERPEEALKLYEKALSLDSSHLDSLVRYAVLRLSLGKATPAETEATLRSVVRLDPTHHMGWFRLGEVLKQLEEHTAASECFLKAIELEESAPVVPFSKLARTI